MSRFTITAERITLILLALGLVGCPKEPAPEKTASAENSTVHPRIICYSPALTKMTFDLGLGDHVVGVDQYSRPPEPADCKVVGSALNVRLEPIVELRPDVILAQMQPKHFQAVRQALLELQFEHFTIETLADVAEAAERIGRIAQRPEAGLTARQKFEAELAELRASTAAREPTPVLFVVGYENPLATGSGTFLDEMIAAAGGRNVLRDRFERWRNVTLETILRAEPALIVCQALEGQAEPSRRYWEELVARSARPCRVVVFDDAHWTLPGLHLPEYARRLADEIHPPPDGGPSP